jgi:hypothetical protein
LAYTRAVNRPLRLVVSTLLAVAVLWHGLLPIAGFDVWWQLALGREVVQQGWPTVDPWSHTFFGQPWPYKDGGSALIYWATYGIGGVAALVVLKAVVFGATVAAWTALVARIAPRAPALVAALAAVVVVSTAFRFTIRPQIFSFALLVACAWVVERARDGKGLWPLVPLVWLNALTHRAALLLPPLLAIWLIARWWDERRGAQPSDAPTHLRRAAAWVGAAAVASVAVPDGLAIVSTSLEMVSDPVLHGAIPEWWSATPVNVWRASPATGVALLAVVAAVVVELRRARDQGGPRAEVLALALVSVIVAFRGVRFLPYLPLIGGLAIARAFADGERWRGRLAPMIGIGSAVVGCLATVTRPLPAPSLGIEPGRVPQRAVEFIRDHQPQGDVFNDFAFGGYLIFTFEGDVPVYIDGRNDIVYPASFIREYVDASSDPRALLALVDQRGIEWLMLPTAPDQPARAAIELQSGFVPVHVDSVATVYAREHAPDPGPNHSLIEEHGYRWLRPGGISRSMQRAFSDPVGREQATAEVERLLADDPDGRFAHVVAARWYSLFGTERVVQQARHERWLRERSDR